MTAPAKAPTPTGLPPGLSPRLIDLAGGIYTRLAGDATRVTDKGVTMTTDPVNLAQLSFKLALAFQKVEDDLNAASLPKNPDFKLDVSDIAAWSK